MTNAKRLQLLLKKAGRPLNRQEIQDSMKMSKTAFDSMISKAMQGNYIHYIGKGGRNDNYYSLKKDDSPPDVWFRGSPDPIPEHHELMAHLFQHVFKGEKHV